MTTTEELNIKKISTIIYSDNTDWDETPCFSEIFEKEGWKYTFIDSDEEGSSFSDEVTWNLTFNVEKNEEEYSIYISGSAIAEISYDRWVDSYGFSWDEEDISINKI